MPLTVSCKMHILSEGRIPYRHSDTCIDKYMMKTFMLLVFIFTYAVQPASAQIHQWGKWKIWGEAGNGTYRNPVLPADFSDVDCIRVGAEYYAISSTFQYSPGMVILHSKDLVNWEILGHAVTDITAISPQMNWDQMNRYGKGIWAGAIRYHAHKFWIYFGTPDEGYFMTTADKPEGPWSQLQCVLAQKGWDDCCPFWDDNGQGYLIGTNYTDGYKVHLFKMTGDGKRLIAESDQVIYQGKGSEANKLYKINGSYYHLFSEVKADGRALMMERSENIYGPYKEVRQLSYAQKEFNEPNQGGLVQTRAGDWYFLTHHGTGDWSGRVLSLLPVNWVEGWPVIGKPDSEKIGRMVWTGKMPVKETKKLSLETSDEFKEAQLLPQWEWNYQPRAGKWSLTVRKGWLRLYAYQPIDSGNLLTAGNTLTQRAMRSAHNKVVIKLDLAGMTDGQHAGLSHFGSPSYAAFGITCIGSTKTLTLNIKGRVCQQMLVNANTLWLKSTWGLAGKADFFFSVDGIRFQHFGNAYQMAWGSYRGDRIALYCYNDKAETGYMDFDFIHYTYDHRKLLTRERRQ